MDDKGETTQMVECGRVEDYEIDDCDICHVPVLRPLCVPGRFVARPKCRFYAASSRSSFG